MIPDDGRFLAGRADKVYVLLRHPLAIWRSGMEAGWETFRGNYLAEQLGRIRRMLAWIPAERLKVVSYYELSSSAGREEFFGRRLDAYGLIEQSRQSGWGDPGELIRSGAIRDLTIEEDVVRAVRGVWMDLGNAELLRAIAEYREILRLVDRHDLDVEIPDLGAEGLVIGDYPRADGNCLGIRVVKLLELGELPIEDGVLDWIWSEDLAPRVEPERLLLILRELRRVLAPGGSLRLSCVNLEFIGRMIVGKEDEYVEWYLGAFLKGRGNRGDVVNHLQRSWGHRYFYEPDALMELMRDAGFVEVRRLVPDEREPLARLPSGLYERERFVTEGCAPLR